MDDYFRDLYLQDYKFWNPYPSKLNRFNGDSGKETDDNTNKTNIEREVEKIKMMSIKKPVDFSITPENTGQTDINTANKAVQILYEFLFSILKSCSAGPEKQPFYF